MNVLNNTVLVGGGDLPEDYHLAQFHFHWGADNSKGSEHFLNGRQFPMEVHSTHNNSATYRASLNAHTTILPQSVHFCDVSTLRALMCFCVSEYFCTEQYFTTGTGDLQ